MAKNGAVMDGIRRLLALLEREVQMFQEVHGFIAKPDLLARLAVVRRFGSHLSDISDWWKLPSSRLSEAMTEIESVLGGFRATQTGYLRKVVPAVLRERLKVLRREPWFSYRRAEELADGLEEFLQLAKNASLSELRSSFIELERRFSEAEEAPAEERIQAVLTPTPSRPKPDRKRDKRLRDQAIRAEMKGISSGGGGKKKGRQARA